MIDPETIAQSKAWPITEALQLVERVRKTPPQGSAEGKDYVLFETGYGPSGLPHIGTFAEVFRTGLVRHAFERLSDIPTRLFAFSDDMDGLRKVPDNIPRAEMVAEHLGKPLTAIPDPFGTHESYGHHMNGRLIAFLDRFNFAYEFKSATQCYRDGLFDEVLSRVLERHEAICDVVRPHLRAERRATYSPILPVSPKSGRVLQGGIEECRPQTGSVVFRDEDGTLTEVPITGGHCKLQWRADWALRWTALAVDYEMSGKDLIDSVKLGGQICRIMGGTPPHGFTYELFLDEQGEKISKSRGNGLTIEEWLRYGTPESLMLFLYQHPKKAKRLFFDVIPRHVDDYYAFIEAFERQATKERLGNPSWHIHHGEPPPATTVPPLSFGMLLNLASVANAEEAETLWGFIRRYQPDAEPERMPELALLVERALAYYRDFVKPNKRFREPTETEREAMLELRDLLSGLGEATPAETIQNEVYEIGKKHQFDNLRDWFKALYQVLLGQEEGPRFGSFVASYGVANTKRLIEESLNRERVAQAVGA